jgi:hypothetical protein
VPLELPLPQLGSSDTGLEAGLGIATAYQAHKLLRRAFIVTHDPGVLLRHRTRHLRLAGFASRGILANIDVAIAHDCDPSLDWGQKLTRDHQQGCELFD